ncbi:Uncharacterised protein [Mycobacteroides abscessus subsp. massiliense]|nr:Uncharacterised protein [Mycobacteroides abscessus subsp. massiliense]
MNRDLAVLGLDITAFDSESKRVARWAIRGYKRISRKVLKHGECKEGVHHGYVHFLPSACGVSRNNRREN